MMHINLLPVRAAQKKEKLRGQVVVLILSVLITVGVCGVAYAALLSSVDKVNKSIRVKEEKIRVLKKTLGEVTEFKKKKANLAEKLDILEKLKDGKSGPVHLLDELSLALPDKLWLESFKESGGTIDLSGVALSEEKVALFLKQLNQSPYYKDVELQVIEQKSQSGVRVSKFKVVAKVEAPPKSASK
jgi:type IV pilus assembly protein PilN